MELEFIFPFPIINDYSSYFVCLLMTFKVQWGGQWNNFSKGHYESQVADYVNYQTSIDVIEYRSSIGVVWNKWSECEPIKPQWKVCAALQASMDYAGTSNVIRLLLTNYFKVFPV